MLNFNIIMFVFFLLQSFVDVMKEFLKGRPSPSDLIFNDPNFSGVTFKKILEENDKLELVEMTMLALLHVSPPVYWTSLHSHGNSLMTIKYFSLFLYIPLFTLQYPGVQVLAIEDGKATEATFLHPCELAMYKCFAKHMMSYN